MKKMIPVLLAVVLLLVGCGKQTHTPTDADTQTTAALSFTDVDDFSVSEVFAYTGPFVEDGSNETLSNVAAIRVQNRSEQAIRYVEFSVPTGAGELRFTCTTLLPGKSVLLLEENRTVFTGAAATGIQTGGKIYFDEPPTLYPETFEVVVSGHVMTLRNLSDKPVPGDIYVYYKKTDADGYLGGITYRVHFSDLAAGREASQSSQNLSDDCEIVFIGCANPPEVGA